MKNIIALSLCLFAIIACTNAPLATNPALTIEKFIYIDRIRDLGDEVEIHFDSDVYNGDNHYGFLLIASGSHVDKARKLRPGDAVRFLGTVHEYYELTHFELVKFMF